MAYANTRMRSFLTLDIYLITYTAEHLRSCVSGPGRRKEEGEGKKEEGGKREGGSEGKEGRRKEIEREGGKDNGGGG